MIHTCESENLVSKKQTFDISIIFIIITKYLCSFSIYTKTMCTKLFLRFFSITFLFFVISCDTTNVAYKISETTPVEKTIECDLKIPFSEVDVVITIPSDRTIGDGLQVTEISEPINNTYKNIIEVTTYDSSSYYYANDKSEPHKTKFEVCTLENQININKREFFRQGYNNEWSDKTNISFVPSDNYSLTK
jgi:hypothetical protein